jgi:hypothetical protein
MDRASRIIGDGRHAPAGAAAFRPGVNAGWSGTWAVSDTAAAMFALP